MTTWRNWAGTASAQLAGIESPAGVEQLQDVVRGAAERGLRIKPIGSGHSFTTIGATDGIQLRLDRLTGIIDADPESGLVTVAAGTRLLALNEALWQRGMAMSNLGDVDVQSISGAISTGTHGTGARLGGISTQIRGLDIVLADGSLVHCSAQENPDLFAAGRIGLGALGVIVALTLQCEPAYALSAREEPDSLDAVLAELDACIDDNDHFEFYWFPHTRRVLTKRNNRMPAGTPLQPVSKVRHYIDDELLSNKIFDGIQKMTTRWPAMIPRANTLAARMLSAREYVDRSYRVFASVRSVRFSEMEYAVPRAAVPHVLEEIQAYLRRSGELIGMPVEVRFVAADDIWLSTANGRESAYIAVHQYHRRDHRAYFDAVEAIARSVDGRPHWGKMHNRTAEDLRPAYPHFDDFVALREKLDPGRVFGNEYLTRVLGS